MQRGENGNEWIIIRQFYKRGMGIREIDRILEISKNTVK